MSLTDDLIKKLREWGPDTQGNCWAVCPAFSQSTGACEALAKPASPGEPCPVYRLMYALGLDQSR